MRRLKASKLISIPLNHTQIKEADSLIIDSDISKILYWVKNQFSGQLDYLDLEQVKNITLDGDNLLIEII